MKKTVEFRVLSSEFRVWSFELQTRQTRPLLFTVYCLLFTVYCSLITDYWLLSPAHAQEQIQIVNVDTSQFPTVQFNLATGGVVPNLDNMTMRENGVPITDFTVNSVPVGIDVVMVLDANETYAELDGGDSTRLERVQESINRFAAQMMNPVGLDRITIIAPNESYTSGQFLVENATNPADIFAAINSYNPINLGVTPLNEMMMLALDHAVARQENGRFQTLLLFTDGAQLNRQLDSGALTAFAQTIQLPLHVAILGAQADSNEIGNAALLYEPTGGNYLHLPSGAEADSLYRQWLNRASQPQISYTSPQKQNGRYTISLNIGQLAISTEYELALQPPIVTVQLAESTIRRVGQRVDSLLTELEPMRGDVPVEIAWPDGTARQLRSLTLFVDGEPQPPTPLLAPSPDGVYVLDWNFRSLGAGEYRLTAEAVDELGYSATSSPFFVTVVVERPLPPTATPIPTATPEAPPLFTMPATEQIVTTLELVGLAVLVTGALLWVQGRRRKQTAPVLAEVVVEEKKEESAVSAPPTVAFLERLDGKADAPKIQLDTDNITIGRDMQVVQVVVDDATVSRLHARIRKHADGYWLYDEGSTQGTFLNFERLGLAPRSLNNQDRIDIGRVPFRFCLVQEVKEGF